jgi:putative ABC transport system substrate-binding protein
MKRRQFLEGVGAAAVAWPHEAWAQQRERLRRVGVLMPYASDDAQWQPRLTGFLQGLEQAGWSVGRNVQIDVRWTAGKPEDIRKYTTEIIALAPDVIFSAGGPTLVVLQQATRTIPIVFVSVADPVAGGFVDNLSHPGGNITGFMNSEYGISGKWLDFLKQVAPAVTRVAVLRDLTNRSGLGQFGALQGAAASSGVEVMPVGVRDIGEIERGISALAREPNGGMIVPQGSAGGMYRHRSSCSRHSTDCQQSTPTVPLSPMAASYPTAPIVSNPSGARRATLIVS